jgi:bifunctional DNase/RNase
LREDGGTRFLPIFIGSPEATAIVYALQGMETPRPMTHDLFKTVLDGLAVTVERVEITALQDGTFYAEIELDREGTKSRISSRPSDAIALAVRFGAEVPIYADEAVLDEAGVLFEADEEEHEVEQFREFLDNITPEDFAQ